MKVIMAITTTIFVSVIAALLLWPINEISPMGRSAIGFMRAGAAVLLGLILFAIWAIRLAFWMFGP